MHRADWRCLLWDSQTGFLALQESATALAEMASSVTPEACETLCVEGIVTLSRDRVWAVRVAAAAAVPSVAVGKPLPLRRC